MSRRRLGFVILFPALALAVAGTWLALAPAAPRGNIAQALQTDLSSADDQKMLSLVSSLQLQGSTQRQRIEFFEHLKARFDAMSLTEKLALLLASRNVIQNAPDGPLANNGRVLMQAYWNRELKTYIQAPPEQRQKMLDARIDESLVYENLQNLQNAARGLFGNKSGPSNDDLLQMRTQITRALVDAMQNDSPEDRAAASQYFQDMQNRRTQRGLPNRF
jgi:hypothetical protein